MLKVNSRGMTVAPLSIFLLLSGGLPTALPLDISTATAIPSPAATPMSCPVTQPTGNQPPPDAHVFARDAGGYGNEALWTALWIWGEGAVSVPETHVLPDGSLGSMKWSWYLFLPGSLEIEGRRLDGDAPPLRAEIPGGYGGIGFQPTGLIFPTGGCWEITGRVDDHTLTFVVLVIPPPSSLTPESTPA